MLIKRKVKNTERPIATERSLYVYILFDIVLVSVTVNNNNIKLKR